MTYSATSADVFYARSDERRTECAVVENAIRQAGHGLTIKEISRITGIVDGTVSARLAELRKARVVEEAPFKRRCSINGWKKKIWQIAMPGDPQRELFGVK